MINKVIYILAMSLICLTGCSDGNIEVLTSENQVLQSENESLKSEIDDLNIKINMLRRDKDNLAQELSEVKNGAEQRIIKIRQSMNESKYQDVISGAEELHELFLGTNEDEEGQQLLQQAVYQLDLIATSEEADRQKLEIEKNKTAKDKVREYITISNLYTGEPNSADGVSWYVVFTNNYEKDIKYIYFDVEPYNAVGDVVSCRIRRTSEFTGKVTGPIASGAQYGKNNYFDCAWYNNTIVECKLTGIKIEYIDGSYKTFNEEEAKLAFL